MGFVKNKLIVQTAKNKDIDVLIPLVRELIEYHDRLDGYYRSNSEMKSQMRKHLRLLMKKKTVKVCIAYLDGSSIGYAIGEISRGTALSPKKVGYIADMYVIPSHRNKGVGKALLEYLMKWFRSKEVERMELTVHSTNKVGVKFWKKLDFKEYMKKMFFVKKDF